MIAVGVRENDRFDRLVAEFAKLRRDATGVIERHARIDDHDAIVAHNHRDVDSL